MKVIYKEKEYEVVKSTAKMYYISEKKRVFKTSCKVIDDNSPVKPKVDKTELGKVCKAEFDVFSKAISKMGFDPEGFSFMILFDKKALSRKKFLNHFNNLKEEEKIAVENRIKLFS